MRDYNCTDCERRRVVDAARGRGASALEPGCSIGFAEPAAPEANLMAPREKGMGGGIRVEVERALQKPRRDPRLGGHNKRHVGQSAQIEVVSFEAIRALTARADRKSVV